VTGDAPSVSVCIRFYYDRPDALRRLLRSIPDAGYPVDEVLVSDDSEARVARSLVAEEFPAVRYLEGPRRGLGANCNHLARHASGDYLLLVDDDVVLRAGSLAKLMECASAARASGGKRERVIVTSRVEEPHVGLIEPREQSFLGFRERTYLPGEPMKTFVFTTVLYPRSVFADVLFDERAFPYEDLDFSTRAVAHGYRIALCREVVNDHYPVAKSDRERYGPTLDAARLYVTLKRYAVTERRLLRAVCFALWAPLHLLAASIKAEGPAGARRAARALWLAARHVASYAVEARASSARS
jgi:GT2 family glycosyltransferase